MDLENLKLKIHYNKIMHTYESDIFDVPYTPCKTEKIKCLCGGHIPPFCQLLDCKFHYNKSLIID